MKNILELVTYLRLLDSVKIVINHFTFTVMKTFLVFVSKVRI